MMKQHAFLAIIGCCALFALVALYKATFPKQFRPQTVSDEIEALAYDAHNRVNDLQSRWVSLQWMFVTVTVMSVICAVFNWRTWEMSRTHGFQQTLEARLCALERQGPFVPAPTHQSHRAVLAPFGAEDTGGMPADTRQVTHQMQTQPAPRPPQQEVPVAHQPAPQPPRQSAPEPAMAAAPVPMDFPGAEGVVS